MKIINRIILALILVSIASFAAGYIVKINQQRREYKLLKQRIAQQFKGVLPHEWSETATGVKMRLNTDYNVIALTLDACGSKGDGYDKKLIDFLIKERIPATLFVSGRWIDKNRKAFLELSGNPLFEIENHGRFHKPLSVNGKTIYGIRGTRSPAEVVDEVEINARKIEDLSGKKPKYFRSGTAYYDEVAVRIIKTLGYEAVGFNIIGDAGATYTQKQVRDAVLKATPGSIIIAHMNHPEKETAEGLMQALPRLRKKGFRFVKLEKFDLRYNVNRKFKSR